MQFYSSNLQPVLNFSENEKNLHRGPSTSLPGPRAFTLFKIQNNLLELIKDFKNIYGGGSKFYSIR